MELKTPDKPDVSGTNILVPYYMVDEINYGDGPTWPSAADGLGNSIQRITPAVYGNDPANWVAGGPTAGRANTINLPPQVTLSAPAHGAAFNRSQSITISAEASDPDGTVESVEFYAGASLLATDVAAPWSYTWSGAGYGTHLVSVRAVDNGGSVSQSAAISITVTSQPPTIELTSPAAGTLVAAGGSVPITASASDVDGVVVSVDIYANGSPIASLSATPWSFNWVPTISGSCEIMAVSRDDSGASSNPASRTVWVQPSVANPVAIPLGSRWRYLDNGVDQGAGWAAPGFPEGNWPVGSGKFGFYNDNTGLGTVLSYGTNASNKYPAYYFRKSFVVSSLEGITNLFLETLRDDGVAVYLNGAPLYRDNLPSGTIGYSQLATNCADNGTVLQTALLETNGLVLGTNWIAAEIHQSSLTSSDAAFDLRLTLLGVQTGPGIVQQPASRQVAQHSAVGFSVGAIGSEPLTYQWRFNGADIAGATAPSYLIASAQPSHAGPYSVVVANAIGSATSADAVLEVTAVANDPIQLAITQQGTSLLLTWTGGTPPFQVQSVADLDVGNWQNVGETTTNRAATIVPGSARGWFRVRGSQ